MSKTKDVEQDVVESAEHARRRLHIENYKKTNPLKAASKKLLSKDGKTMISLDEWVDEA